MIPELSNASTFKIEMHRFLSKKLLIFFCIFKKILLNLPTQECIAEKGGLQNLRDYKITE